MTEASKTILAEFQVRKSKKQKAAFRDWLCGQLEQAGYTPAVEKGFAARNVVVGDPESAEVLFTAHYDTQAVLPVPNFITPKNARWYLLYQILLMGGIFLIAGLAAGVALLLRLPVKIAMPIFGVVSLICCWWIIDGPANQHTVNDNTSGVVTLMETALALPPENRAKVCFVFFDNEEKGMLGSSAFAGKHKQVKKGKLVVNFDCVSDGSSIQFFPTRKLRKEQAKLESLEKAFRNAGDRQVAIVRGFGFYPSDNAAFRLGAGVCALRKHKVFGWYMSRIHTARDTVMEEENIKLLRDGCLRLAAGVREG